MPTSTQYAFTRSLNPATGDRYVSGGAAVAGAPLTEIVLRVLRTQRGSYLPDPAFGLDYSIVQKASANAPATLEKAVRAALDYLVRGGSLTKLAVTVERQGTALVYDVSFTDPRTMRSDTVRRTI